MEINLHYGENVTLAQLKKIASFGINVEVLNGNYLIVFDILDGSEQHQRLKAEFPDLAPICEWYIFPRKKCRKQNGSQCGQQTKSWGIPAQRKLSLTAVTRAIIMIRR